MYYGDVRRFSVGNSIVVGGVALAILFFLGAISAEAETIDELQKQIGSKNTEIRRLEEEAAKFRKEIGVSQERQKTLKAELARIDTLLAGLRRDIAITQQKIERASLEIMALTIEIGVKEDSIKTLRSGIAGLIESLRERSVESPLFIFVKYWRLSDFFSQLESIEIVSDRIFGFLTEVKRIKGELEIKKAVAENKKKELSDLKLEISAKKQSQEGVKKDRSNILVVTKEEEKRYQEMLKDREKRSRALEEEIFAIEEKIRITIDPASLPPKKPGVLASPLPDISTKSCWDGGESAKNCVTQYFGNTPFAISGAYNGKGHNGIDFRASFGTPVRAALSGVVEAVGDTDLECKGVSYGKWVLVKHGNNLSTAYAHLSTVNVSPGQGVARSDLIGYSGSTGYATGPHLHFTVFATQGVQVQKVKSKVCGTYMTVPISALNAYLNPLDYL